MRLRLLAVICLLLSSPLFAADLEVGVAVRDITPPVGYRMSGYFYERLSTGTHDPLYAKAIVLKQGDERAALVFCDLIGISRTVSDAARKEAAEQTKIPVANIVVAATHSHTGPLYAGLLRDHFHAQAVAKHGHDPAEKLVDYPAWLTNRIVDAIAAANRTAVPAKFDAAQHEQTGVSFNRRFHMKDGTVRFNPGRMNPDIVRTAGPIDPQLSFVAFRDANYRPIAGLTVFALHLDTVSGTLHSGDYPHVLAKRLAGTFDGVSLFGAGTCGDINHIDVTKDKQPAGQAMAEHIAGELAANIVKNMNSTAQEQTPSLSGKSATVLAPLQKYSAAEVEKAKVNFPKVGGKELSFLEQVEACKIVSLQSLPKDNLALEVQAFRLSDGVAIVCLPGEVFVELGLAIKEQSPFKHRIVIELCNEAPGYIPTKKAFAEGSYETVNSVVATGGGELLVEAAVKLLKELKK